MLVKSGSKEQSWTWAAMSHSLNLGTNKDAKLFSLSHTCWRGMHPWWGWSWNILPMREDTLKYIPIISDCSCTLLGFRVCIFPTTSTGVLTRCLILCKREILHNQCRASFTVLSSRWLSCINWNKRVFHGKFSLPMKSSPFHNPIIRKIYPHHLIYNRSNWAPIPVTWLTGNHLQNISVCGSIIPQTLQIAIYPKSRRRQI